MKKSCLVSTTIGVFVALSATSAYATCTMPSTYGLTQGNGFGVNLNDVHKNPDKKNGFFADARSSTGVKGQVSGSLNKKGRLSMRIEWDGGSIGVYTGLVLDDGTVGDGRTFDEAHPASWSTWEGSTTIDCEDDE